jgi:hypothetical protein
MGGFTPFYRLVYLLPGTKFFRAPSTMMFVAALSVSALAAIGTARVLAGDVTNRFVIGAAVAVGALALLGASGALSTMFAGVVLPQQLDAFEANQSAVRLGALRMLVVAALAVVAVHAATTRKVSAAIAGWLLAAVVVADLWSVERHYWTFSPPAAVTFASDPAIERIKADSIPGRTFAVEEPRRSRDPFLNYDGLMAHGVRTVMGYQGNSLARYNRLVEEGLSIGASEAWALLNVQWIYTDLDSLPIAEFERVVGPVRNAYGSSVYLFRFRGENPYAWVVPRMLKAPDEVTFATITQPGFPVRSVAIFDSASTVQAGEPSAPPPLGIRARTTRYAPGYAAIELDAPAPEGSALVVSENFYPGWTATVDGREASAERVNYTFIGVPLAAGARRVELRFTSPAYETGKRVTLAALLVAVVLVVAGAGLDRRRGVAA